MDIFISNGPGDPAAMDYAIETVKEILNENKPTIWYLSGSPATGAGQWYHLLSKCTMVIAD